MKKLHYLAQDQADSSDIHLKMAIGQGYVPKTCLLVGQLVLSLVKQSRDPCKGCACERTKCHGRSR